MLIILLFFVWRSAWYKQLLIGYDQLQMFKITLKDMFPTKIVLWWNFINEWVSYDIMLRIKVHVIISAKSYASKSTMTNICQSFNLSILVTLISYIDAEQIFSRMFWKVGLPKCIQTLDKLLNFYSSQSFVMILLTCFFWTFTIPSFCIMHFSCIHFTSK